MKNLTQLLLLIVFVKVGSIFAQEIKEENSDKIKVEQSIISWADSTFKEYDEPRFEKYRANYTDEYLMASLRAKGIDERISELKEQYSTGQYSSSKKEFKSTIEDLEKRKKEAEKNMDNFHPKVTNYVIHFWANILLDSGVTNYVNQRIILNDNYRVIKTKIIGNIGDNENAKIVYR